MVISSADRVCFDIGFFKLRRVFSNSYTGQSTRLPAPITDMMKAFYQTGALLIALSLGVGYFCYPSHAGVPERQERERSPALSATQLTRTKQLFKERCTRCHGSDGRGQTVVGGMLDIPDFTEKSWWNDVEDDRLIDSVRNGKGGMPRFGKKLTSDQIALLVSYVRQFEKSSR
jgi:cytochrome c6